jgi:hypothetical protein
MPTSTTILKPAEMPTSTRGTHHNIRVLADLFVRNPFVTSDRVILCVQREHRNLDVEHGTDAASIAVVGAYRRIIPRSALNFSIEIP